MHRKALPLVTDSRITSLLINFQEVWAVVSKVDCCGKVFKRVTLFFVEKSSTKHIDRGFRQLLLDNVKQQLGKEGRQYCAFFEET